MSADTPRIDHIFNIAAEIRDPVARAAYLGDACRGDEGLRREVEELLRHDQDDKSFLAAPAATMLAHAASDAPGTQIGPYRLLERIGEGGFGIVYMAEQEQPVRRKVALKIIKPGMDTAQVIARFEAERQALAIMEHPHIAKVYDAGATESGRPYFAMELVKGVPITEFCDKNRMPAEQRLKLFVNVCHAVQHAHHKGVIHRDLKPSNVLVTLHDPGAPGVVKVIDFGIAKAMGRELTDRTLFTAFAQLVGTPLYMSPEQAEMSGLDIDTRSDIYSLGVLLYELLTGTTPLEAQRLREAGYAELQRLIREEESPRPSTRLSSLGESATVVAGNRAADPKQLARLLAGEVDWIVMKALEKDRNRRYSTPGDFAADIERYLRRDLVLARPPSTAYRMKKFVQRNRVAALTGSAITAALVIGLVLATWGMFAAREAERRAVTARNAEAAERRKADAALAGEAAARRKADAALTSEAEARRRADAALAAEADARRRAEEQAIRLRVERTLPRLERTRDDPRAFLELSQILMDVPDDLPEWRQYLCLNVLAWGQRIAPLVALPTHDGFPVTHIAVSPDQQLLLTQGIDGSLRLWEFLTLQPRAALEHDAALDLRYEHNAPGFTSDGRTIWTLRSESFDSESERVALFWETSTGRLRQAISVPARATVGVMGHGNRMLTMAAAASTVQKVLGASDDEVNTSRTVRLFDTTNGRQVSEFDVGGACNIYSSSDSRLLVLLANAGNRVQVVGPGRHVLVPADCGSAQPHTSGDDRVQVFSAADGSLVQSLEFDAPVRSIGFSPSGAHLVALTDTDVRWWRTLDWQPDGKSQREPWAAGQHFAAGLFCFTDDLIGIIIFQQDAGGGLQKHAAAYRRGHDGELPFRAFVVQSRDDLLLANDGTVFHGPTLQPVRAAGRRFPPEAAEFANQGRFLAVSGEINDLTTELRIGPPGAWANVASSDVGLFLPPSIALNEFGLEDFASSVPWVFLPARLDVLDPETVALWARVVARGELADEGEYVAWDEATWDAHRRELLQAAQPLGTLPFPGTAGADSLYWLREAIRRRSSPSEFWAQVDRLVAVEAAWQNYARRAQYNYSSANDSGQHLNAVRDQLDAARLAGPAFWKVACRSSECWKKPFRIALDPRHRESEHELVLHWAEEAQSASGERNLAVVAALALYRLGRPADALEHIRFAVMDGPDGPLPRLPEDWTATPNAPLVAAMCFQQLGRPEVARTLFESVRQRAQEMDSGVNAGDLVAGYSPSGIYHGLLREAEQLIDPPAAGPPPRTDGSGADAAAGLEDSPPSDLSATTTT